MKRFMRIAVAVASIAILPVVAQASTSRLQGMNLQGDYTKDYTAIYGWPSSLTGVGNLIYGELGNDLVNVNTGNPFSYERSMGAVLTNLWDGRFGTWGIHMRDETPSLGQGDQMSGPNPGVGGNDVNSNGNEQFDIMWGKNFGSTSFGLRINRSFMSLEDELPGVTSLFEADGPGTANQGDENLARNVFGIGAGIGFEMNENTSTEFSVLYQTRTFENSQTAGAVTNAYQDNGGTTYLVAGRMMWKWQPNILVVPVAKFYSFDLSNEFVSGATTTSFENKLSGWQIGVSGNWALGSNDLFVAGVQVAQNKLDTENDVFNLNGGVLSGFGFTDELQATETLMPNIFMALESQVNSWLTLRMGAQKAVMHTYKVEDNSSDPADQQTLTLKDSPFSMNIGAGVKVGNLQFDAVLDDLFYLNPVAQTMGSDNGYFFWNQSMATKVSATYAW